MRRLRWPVALAMIAGATAASAQSVSATIALPCVSPPEAEALVASVAPELIAEVGRVCTPALPPGATLRQANGALVERYRAEADRAWPQGRGAITKITGPDIGSLLGGDLARPLLATLVLPLLTKNLVTADCASLDRIVTLAQPLPPRNMAGLLVAVLQLVDSKRVARGAKPTLPICQSGAR